MKRSRIVLSEFERRLSDTYTQKIKQKDQTTERVAINSRKNKKLGMKKMCP